MNFTIIRIFLLSFLFAYNGGLLNLIIPEDGSIHTFQIILGFLGFIFSVNYSNPLKINRKAFQNLLIFLLFCLYFQINQSPDAPEYSSYKIALLWWNFLMILFVSSSIKNFKEIELFIVFGLFQILLGILLQGVDFNAVGRTGAGEPIITSRLAAILLCFGLFFNKNKKLLFRSIFGLLGFIFIVLTGTRTLFLSFTLLLVVASFIDFNNLKIRMASSNTRKSLLVYSAVVSIVLISFSYNILGFNEDLISRFYNSFELLGNQNQGNSVLERMDQWQTSIAIFIERPLSGLGLGGFGHYYYGYDMRLYPHNIIWEVIAEGGLLGFSIFLLFLSKIWRSFRFNVQIQRTPTYLNKFIFSLLFIGLLTSFSSLELPNQFILFNAIGLILAINGFRENQTHFELPDAKNIDPVH